MPAHRDNVRAYYDQNTQLFLAFGNGRRAQNIHRALWADGVKTHEEALNVSNQRILREIEAVAPSHARVADLGCGVGASVFHIFPCLAEPDYAVGLTISQWQARLAAKMAREIHVSGQILFIEGDFTHTPLENGSLDAVFSVEAVVHTPDPESYFYEASRLLRTGGRLIVLDDCRAARTLQPAEAEWLNAFIDGWHVPGVRTVEQIQTLAKRHALQLIKNQDFTPLLRLRTLPDGIAKLLRFLGRLLPIKHAILPSMLGSMALQQCLHQNVIEYRFLVFEKT